MNGRMGFEDACRRLPDIADTRTGASSSTKMQNTAGLRNIPGWELPNASASLDYHGFDCAAGHDVGNETESCE
jgi:hypothetical protein